MAFRPGANRPEISDKASALERLFFKRWGERFPDLPLLTEFDDIETWEADYKRRLRASKRSQRYRMDFAYEPAKVAIEVQGGIYTGGRHTTGCGYERDATKYNLATASGWIIFLLTPGMVKETSGKWYDLIAATIAERLKIQLPDPVDLTPLEGLDPEPSPYVTT